MLTLSACGPGSPSFSIMPTNQVFKQAPGFFNNQLDILFVIDSSGSMGEEQVNLASNFSAFINDFQTKGYDFKIAVIGTDAYLANSQLSGYNSANSSVAKFRDRAIKTSSGVYQAISNDSICGNPAAPFTNVFVITPSTPNLSSVFSINAKQCIRGNGDERAFSSFMTALNSPLNAGFLRPQSFLAVIIVSDEDDFSGYNRPAEPGGDNPHDYSHPDIDPVNNYVTQLDTLTNSTSSFKRYNVSNISRLDENCGGHREIQYPSRYMQLSTLTNGISGSICDPNFSTSLNLIQKNIAELSTQFYLDRTPQVDTIVVTVNGVKIAQDPVNGWTHNATINSIVFHGASIPPQGAAISISFVPATVK